ncbi:MAG: hypothetical protein KF752_07535 [Pirellulaceae bacterium]|nr:hypothetical protein [Pirellulaceae bacterium]
MAKKTESTALPEGQQDIEGLKRRYEKLNEKKIAAQTKQGAAEDRLKQLKSQALLDYGTDDLELLKKKLHDLLEENERQRSDYQRHLEAIEAQLAEVEQSNMPTS